DRMRPQLPVAICVVVAQALVPRKPKGLVAAYEMLVITPAISNLIRENKTYRIDSSIQTGRKHGMILLDDSLFNLWRQGLVEEQEVLYKARKVTDLRERIEKAKRGVLEEDGEEEEEEGAGEKRGGGGGRRVPRAPAPARKVRGILRLTPGCVTPPRPPPPRPRRVRQPHPGAGATVRSTTRSHA